MTVDAAYDGRSPRRGRRRVVATRPAARHRLEVLATTADDVVHGAGGWLADRALAGWDVEVLLAEAPADLRQLRILGVSAGVLHRGGSTRPRPDAVAVSAELFAGDAHVSDYVLRAYERDLLEVTVWGRIPGELAARFTPVEHVLSGAARLFKKHALCGAGPFGPVEGFCSGALRGLGDDLTPASGG